MGEIKNVRVREARDRDIGLFRKLWLSLLTAEAEKGSIIAPEESIELYETLFNAYVSGTFEGTVLFVADKAVLMWGTTALALRHTPGRLLTAWGMHVEPEAPEGVSKALSEAAETWAKEHGFDGAVAQFHGDEEEGYEVWAKVAYRKFDV